MLDGSKSDAMKGLLVFLPILSSALALFFDVGYFYALDINLFTVFSLAEHLNFTLEALPIALAIAVFGMLAVVIGERVVVAESKALAQSNAAPGSRSLRSRWPSFIAPGLFLLLAVNTWLVPGPISLVCFVFTALVPIVRIVMPSGDSRRAMLNVLGGTFLLSLSFAVGFDASRRYSINPDFRHTIKTEAAELKAKIVRSGERGLLFHDQESKQLMLLQWSEIKKVTYGIR